MKQLFDLAYEVQDLMVSEEWSFCFIGGLALQRWGENRLTRDIDLVVMVGFGNERTYIDRLLARFRPRIPDAVDFAVANRVLLAQSEAGIGIDVLLAALPFEAEMVDRASPFEFLPGCALQTCSAEDLVVLKSFAARPQDWVDVRGVLVRQGARLDREAILLRLRPLVTLKEEPEILDRLQDLYRAT